MHEFHYRGNKLYCEGVEISRIAEKFGTPLYIYSRKTLSDHYRKIAQAFRSLKPLICFSVKANSNLAVLKVLANLGAGMDVVSGGELYQALKAGAAPKKIVYAGVGKSKSEIAQAVREGILFFNVESLPELALIDQVAGQLHKKVNVCLRINPDINPHTHRFITTGRVLNKFGLDMQTAEDIFLRRSIFSNLNLIGLHIHIGSQITEPKPFVQAIKKALRLITRLKNSHVALKYFNIGGGLGIVYHREHPQTAKEFAAAVLGLLQGTGLKVILEPGRFIAGNSGILVTRVVYIKKTEHKDFAIVDAGMNDLIRPALYDAYHEILPVIKTSRPADQPTSRPKYDIVGPICESADFLAKDRILPNLQAGNLLAVMGAGAYGFTMSSNYNSRLRTCEILVEGKRFFLVRKRETYRDLIRQQIIPRNLR
ncbi:MAG: diaminopimelate decarboxylase [Candidatus Omnitrophica bacterium]|nr:diaminopimelate decarboxylase [Candidatus Omnitrophota bacterium]